MKLPLTTITFQLYKNMIYSIIIFLYQSFLINSFIVTTILSWFLKKKSEYIFQMLYNLKFVKYTKQRNFPLNQVSTIK